MTLMTLDKNSLVRGFSGCSKMSPGVPSSAIIYLILNILLGKGLSLFERRLKKSEK